MSFSQHRPRGSCRGRASQSVYGHYLLDLNLEYGLVMSSLRRRSQPAAPPPSTVEHYGRPLGARNGAPLPLSDHLASSTPRVIRHCALLPVLAGDVSDLGSIRRSAARYGNGRAQRNGTRKREGTR